MRCQYVVDPGSRGDTPEPPELCGEDADGDYCPEHDLEPDPDRAHDEREHDARSDA